MVNKESLVMAEIVPLDWLWDHLSSEYSMIVGAPVIFTASMLAVSAIIYWFVRRRYVVLLEGKDVQLEGRNVEITIHEQRLKLKDETIEQFKEFLKQADRASPSELRNDIAELKAELERQKPRILTEEQRKTFVDLLKPALWAIPDWRGVQYRVRPDNPEAVDYAAQFIATLYPAGLSAGAFMFSQDIALDLRGLVIQVADTNRPPREATLLLETLQKAGIEARIGALRIAPVLDVEHGYALAIGAK